MIRPKIIGYAAVFNRLTSERFGEVHGFREVILPGAFRELLAGKPDVRAFYSHDEARLLGRTRSGTLVLREDERGLYCEIDPPETQLGRDTIEEIRRGDLSGMSLRMGNVLDSFRREAGGLVRTISKVGRVVEVSPVSMPAYPDTTLQLRHEAQPVDEYDAWTRDHEMREHDRNGLDARLRVAERSTLSAMDARLRRFAPCMNRDRFRSMDMRLRLAEAAVGGRSR